MISDPEQKIGRPRQLYTGPTRRDYPVGAPIQELVDGSQRGDPVREEEELVSCHQ
jgi:hypothetical protein